MKKLLITSIFFITLNSLSQTKSEIQQSLIEMANDMNANLPMNIDKYTVLVNVSGNFGKLFYNYIIDESLFTDFGYTKDEWKKLQNEAIKNSYCTNPAFSFSKQYDIPLTWNYSQTDGVFIHKIELSGNDCKE